MSSASSPPSGRTEDKRLHPFRRAVLRGLAVLLPPLLTIVIFIWVWNTLREYVLIPVEGSVKHVLIWTHYQKEIKNSKPYPDGANQRPYIELENGQWIPNDVYDVVKNSPGADVMPNTAEGVYRRYVEIKFLPWYLVGPVFIGSLLIILGLLGRFLAAGMGRMAWNGFDRLVHQLPIVRNVYGSVKQVTDFLFSEREIEFTRVVAVEYPRKGIWSVGFVTSESLLDIRSAANEPVVTVLMPTSPIPGTGFAINVRKSETIDLNITIDQALQFIVSCGVVIPPQQMTRLDAGKAAGASSSDPGNNGQQSEGQQALPSPGNNETSED